MDQTIMFPDITLRPKKRSHHHIERRLKKDWRKFFYNQIGG